MNEYEYSNEYFYLEELPGERNVRAVTLTDEGKRCSKTFLRKYISSMIDRTGGIRSQIILPLDEHLVFFLCPELTPRFIRYVIDHNVYDAATGAKNKLTNELNDRKDVLDIGWDLALTYLTTGESKIKMKGGEFYVADL